MLREGLRLVAEAQSFNMLNRANFNQPDAVVDQTLTFGKIFSAKDPRQIRANRRSVDQREISGRLALLPGKARVCATTCAAMPDAAAKR